MLATAGTLRFNSVTDQAEICLDTGSWAVLSSGMSWPLLAPNGSDTAPSYAFSNFSGAGLYHNATKMEFVAAHPKTTLGAAAGTAFRVASKGGVQIGDTTVTCDGASEGTLKFSIADEELVFCDGTEWVPFYIPDSIFSTLISLGYAHSCGTKADGTLWCWGRNDKGQLNDGTTTDSDIPIDVSGGDTWKFISNGKNHSCGIKADDTAWCWGYNWRGQLGDGTETDSNVPVAVSGGHTWKTLAARGDSTCGLKSDNTAWCWGGSPLGSSVHTGNSSIPIEVDGGATWKVLTAKCGIKNDDTAWCWGANTRGRVGDGTTTDRTTPVAVSGGGTWKTIYSGRLHSCGIKTDGTAWCWGEGYNGGLGNGSTSFNAETSPVAVLGGHTWKDISVDNYFSCGIKSDDTAWCWGANGRGQLGDGTTTTRSTPVTVSGGGTWKKISTGSYYSCGIKSDNTAWCWGYNGYGKLGDGTTTERHVPTAVSGW
jgi:alpha-tubulin suppressor-like RCC1 family protein